MNFIIKWLSFAVMMFSILFNTIDATFLKDAPEPKSEAQLIEMQDRFDNPEINNEITVVKLSELSISQLHTIIALQGLVARKEPAIFIDYGSESHRYALEEMKKAGYTLSETDADGNPWNFSSVIKKFSSHITDGGYILFKTYEDHGQLNTATNLATINGWLPVACDNEEAVINLGLKKSADISEDNINLKYLKNFYKENKEHFRNDSLVHLYYYANGMRDFAIQQNIFVIYIEDSDFTGRLFRDKVMKNLKPASIIFGWCQYEVKFTESASRYGHSVIPSDHSYNLSILSSFEVEKAKFNTKLSSEVTLDENKHYVSLVYSDGDNLQWIQNGFSEFHTWQGYNSPVPVSWTFSPIAKELSSVDIKRTLTTGEGVAFTTGPSGGGYARISKMNSEELEAFSDYSASLMLESGLNIITFLDEYKGLNFDKNLEKRLSYFSRYDNIEGGIIQLDPDRYSAGKGKVFFSNDKPFVTVGFSLWYPSGNPEEVTNEWLKEQAQIINAKKAELSSINGYTIINIHPWTIGTDDLQYFISQLDDNIEIIGVDELLSAIEQNVPHEFAQPE